MQWTTGKSRQAPTHSPNFLGRIAQDAAHCYRCIVVYLSVCLLVTSVMPAKTAELIEVAFGVGTFVGPNIHVLDVIEILHGRFGGFLTH